MLRELLSAIPTPQVAAGFACDAVLFWIVAYFQDSIEPAWLIPVMQCMIGFDMLLTVVRAYDRKANTPFLVAIGHLMFRRDQELR